MVGKKAFAEPLTAVEPVKNGAEKVTVLAALLVAHKLFILVLTVSVLCLRLAS